MKRKKPERSIVKSEGKTSKIHICIKKIEIKKISEKKRSVGIKRSGIRRSLKQYKKIHIKFNMKNKPNIVRKVLWKMKCKQKIE